MECKVLQHVEIYGIGDVYAEQVVGLMDEHMMAAEIAALRNEIETLKPLAEKGLRAERVVGEIEAEIERKRKIYFRTKDPQTMISQSCNIGGMEYALDRLKGVE